MTTCEKTQHGSDWFLGSAHTQARTLQHQLESKGRRPTLGTGQVLSGTAAHHTSLSPYFEEPFYHLLPSPNPQSSPPFGTASSDFSLFLPGSSRGPSRLQSGHSFAPWHSPLGGAGQQTTGKQETQQGRTTQGAEC